MSCPSTCCFIEIIHVIVKMEFTFFIFGHEYLYFRLSEKLENVLQICDNFELCIEYILSIDMLYF